MLRMATRICCALICTVCGQMPPDDEHLTDVALFGMACPECCPACKRPVKDRGRYPDGYLRRSRVFMFLKANPERGDWGNDYTRDHWKAGT